MTLKGAAALLRWLLRPGIALTGLGCVGIAIFAANALQDGRAELIQSDGEGYYAWVRSVVIDGDVDFTNEYSLRYQGQELQETLALRTPRGLPLDKYSVGLSLVELPATATAHLVSRLAGARQPTGYEGIYQWSVALSLLGCGLLALWTASIRVAPADDTAVWNLLWFGSLGATNLVEYVSRGISMTHLTDVALIALAWCVATRMRDAPVTWRLLGLLGGLAFVTRFTSVLVLPWIAASAVHSGKRIDTRAVWQALSGAAVPLGCQLAANWALWGQLLPEPYPGEYFYWSDPHILGVLFSQQAGWLLWNPWNAVLLVGLALAWRSYAGSLSGRLVWFTAAGGVVAMTLVNAAWSSWTFGFGFGHRGFLALLPVMTITVGCALPDLVRILGQGRTDQASRILAGITLAFVVWNAYVWLGFNVILMRAHGTSPTLADCLTWPSLL